MKRDSPPAAQATPRQRKAIIVNLFVPYSITLYIMFYIHRVPNPITLS